MAQMMNIVALALLFGLHATGSVHGVEEDAPQTSLFLVTGGLDYITKQQMTDIAKAKRCKVEWVTSVVDGVPSFQLFASDVDKDSLDDAIRGAESLDANVFRVEPASMVHRFLSLPKVSLEVCVSGGWPESLTVRGIHVDRELRRVRKSPAFRSLAKRYGLPLAAEWGLRSMGSEKVGALAPQDVFLLWQDKEHTWRLCVRFQLFNGRLLYAGRVPKWPRSYARGLRNHGDADKPPFNFDD